MIRIQIKCRTTFSLVPISKVYVLSSSGVTKSITPTIVEHSGTVDGHEARYATDENNKTYSQTKADDYNSTWIKFTLDKVVLKEFHLEQGLYSQGIVISMLVGSFGIMKSTDLIKYRTYNYLRSISFVDFQVYCVEKVLRYGGGPKVKAGSDSFIWSGSNFSCAEQKGCKEKTVSVYLSESQENGSSEKSDQKNSQSKCKRGDTVTIQKFGGKNLYVNELAVVVDESGR